MEKNFVSFTFTQATHRAVTSIAQITVYSPQRPNVLNIRSEILSIRSALLFHLVLSFLVSLLYFIYMFVSDAGSISVGYHIY